MTAVRTLLHYLNQLVTTTGQVWWRCLPRLLITAMLGWEPADLVGRRVSEVLVPEGLRPAHEAGLERVRGGGAVQHHVAHEQGEDHRGGDEECER